MGDRAVIHFTDDRGELSPAVYLHWGGSEVPARLSELRRLMADRAGDVAYTAARFVGINHARDPEGNLSLGIWNGPESATELADPEHSHGDAGVFLVNVSGDTWTARCWNGYGFDGIPGANRRGDLPSARECAVSIDRAGNIKATTA